LRNLRSRLPFQHTAFAVTVSLCLIAGCTTPTGGLLVPTTTTTTGNVVSPGGGNVVAPGSGNAPAAATEGVALAFTAIQGQATFHGQPLANAEIRILDARTDAPAVIAPGGANVIAPGGGNVIAAGGGNVIAAGGGNVIAPGGGNVIAPGGGNVIAPGGGNVIAAGGGNVIAAGGGNVIAAGGGNVIAAGGGNLRTDAQGNFNLNIAGLSGGGMARLVVVAGGNAMTTLVSDGGALTPQGYRVQQAGGAVQAPINEVTTTVSHLAYGALHLSRLVKPAVGAPIVTTMMEGLQAEAAKYDAAFKAQPNTANSLIAETDPLTGAPRNPKNSIIPTLLANTNTKKTVFALNKDVIAGIAKGVADPESQASDLEKVREEVQDVPFVGTGLTASAGAGTITLETAGGQTVSLDLKDPTSLDATLSSTSFTQALEPPTTSSSGGSNAGQPGPTGPVYPAIAAGPLAINGAPVITLPNAGPLALTDIGGGTGTRAWVTTAGGNTVRVHDLANNTFADLTLSHPAGPLAATDTAAWVSAGTSWPLSRLLPPPVTPAYFSAGAQQIQASPSPNVPLYAKVMEARLVGGVEHIAVTDEPMDLVSRFYYSSGSINGTNAYNVNTLFGLDRPVAVAIDGTRTWFLAFTATGAPRLMCVDSANNPATFSVNPAPGFGTPAVPLPLAFTGQIPTNPMHMTMDHTSGDIWVSDNVTNQVIRYHGYTAGTTSFANGAFTSYLLPAGCGPAEMAHDGTDLWVLNRGNNSVSLLDSTGLKGTLVLGFAVGGIAVTAAGECGVTDKANGKIYRISKVPGV
jgi:hypothetical protein